MTLYSLLTRVSGFALVCTTTLISCGTKEATPPPPPAVVTTIEVAEGDAQYYDAYPGTITALNEVELRPQVTGYITGIHFTDGQFVTKGQLLYTLDQQVYQANVASANAQIAVAKANLNKAQKDADRYKALDEKQAIAKQVLDHALADLESAKMQVKAAEAALSGTQTNLRYSKIVAPFSGTIGISMVKTGAAVSPGTTLLNTISTDNPIAVDFFLDQKDLINFQKIKDNKASSDSVFTMLLPDGNIYPHTGTVASIDRAVDAATGTIRVRLAFDNNEKMLKPGMTASVRIKHREAAQTIVIPFKAVNEQMGEYFVYMVTDSSTVTQTRVALGAHIGDRVVIKEGLEKGRKIVIEGLQRVREGAKIQEDNQDKKAE